MAKVLLIVDTQPTFCEGGGLAVAGGNDCAARIAAYVREHADSYDVVVASQDWHIDPGEHWAEWPVHGKAGSAEAELHPALADALGDVDHVLVRKGMRAAAYSAFEGVVTTDPGELDPTGGRPLGDVLVERGATEVDLVGIATDHCVRASALDAAAAGLDTRVLVDLCVGVSEETTAQALAELEAAGVDLVR